jgi:hypothetical protein
MDRFIRRAERIFIEADATIIGPTTISIQLWSGT